MNKTKKTIMSKFSIVVSFIILFLIIITTSVFAIVNLLKKSTKDNIPLANCGMPELKVENNKSGNDQTHQLLCISQPNFNEFKYTYKTIVEEKASLQSNGFPIEEKMYLKIFNKKFDSKGTFDNPDEYFSLEVKVKNKGISKKYDDAQKPEFDLDKGKNGEMFIIFEVQQKEQLPPNVKEPKLDLTCEYEVVDKHGNTFADGTIAVTPKGH